MKLKIMRVLVTVLLLSIIMISCGASDSGAESIIPEEEVVLTELQVDERPYKLNVKIKGLSDQEIFLAYHYGDKQYMKDTVMLDANGQGVFEGTEPLPRGVYLIVLPSKNYFEIIVSEQQFSIENDTADLIKNFTSKGSVENEVFYKDLQFISKRQETRKDLEEELKAAEEKENEKEIKKIKDELKKLDDEVKAHRKQIQLDYPNLFYSRFLNMVREVPIPDAPKNADGTKDTAWEYYYYKAHYFDHFDFTEEGILRTPVHHSKVMYYFDKVVVQTPDSLIKAVDHLLKLAEPTDELYKYWAVTLLNKYANSKVMCMDKVYVHMGKMLYCDKKAWWADNGDLYRICERAKAMEPTMCGETAGQLILQDLQGQYQALHATDSKYTLLYFYASDCGHCKKEIPKVKKAYDEVIAEGYDIKVFAVNTKHLQIGKNDDGSPKYATEPEEVNEWAEFVKEQEIEDWINVADLYVHNNMREDWDIQSTPRPFLLDSNMVIIAKRFGGEQLKEILEDLRERDEKLAKEAKEKEKAN